ncbi:ATP-binding cassette domain-containing protein [Sulfurovum sp. XTW-4]|uniref:ATP-binding cassette domain-containing protein n=1 Tax=Sulfurovum xiamenensis TaxID=3019066 RepID=A0ABT7QSZ6_9BACT|nr:ATP-binding cassette domain-containing protein [Sulfurovum xiamenensis]MDM5264207.1 ATP-binding cassette domain-containing protein [Sulfurovum xiamenensis]
MLKIIDVKYQHKNAEDMYTYTMVVKPKEIVAIVGQSGSGKSTLLDLLAGFLPATSGSIKLDEDELIDETVEARPISILFQNHNLFEHLSVQKNILLGISKTLKSTHEELKKVKTILKEVGLEKYEHTIVSSLSGGQQQRVALARVLLRREPILLLDEPFTGLDADTRMQMLDLLKKITVENNLHTIMITHEIEDSERIANRVYKVENQKLVEQ